MIDPWTIVAFAMGLALICGLVYACINLVIFVAYELVRWVQGE